MADVQQLIFDIITRPHTEGIDKTGLSARSAAGDVGTLQRRLDELGRKSADARVTLSGNKQALADLDRMDAKLVALDRKTANPNLNVEGAARALAEVSALDVALDKVGGRGGSAPAAASGMASMVSPMMAAGAAAAVLSPVLVTVGLGTAGLGVAAAGTIAPLLKAAQASGGLQANMSKLDPEQRKAAMSLLSLQGAYQKFEKALAPTVLNDFNSGVRTAGHLLHDLQPVSQATGKALGTVMDRIDAEFQSRTWQDFFGFMARTAGPDVKLLGDTIINLTDTLPPLLRSLQPVAIELLQVVAAATRLIDVSAHLEDRFTHTTSSAQRSGGMLGFLAHATSQAVGQMLPGIPAAKDLSGWVAKLGNSSNAARGPTDALTAAHLRAKTAAQQEKDALTLLTNAMNKNVTAVLVLQGDELGWRQAMQAATTQLKSNTAGLAGNSANALANKQAVLQATNAAVTFASDQLKLHGNLQQASNALQAQIGWLQRTGDKSAFTRNEIHALRAEEALIKARLATQISVSGRGSWSVVAQSHARSQGPGPFATGGRITVGSGPTADDVLIRASKNETVVSAAHSAILAPVFRAVGVPGYAAGGVVGSYSGAANGAMGGWAVGMWNKSVHALESAVAAATFAGMKAAAAAASAASFGVSGGPGGGAPGANAALARRLFPQWGSGPEWGAWNYLAMRESGWNQFARNPSSGAYGIAQALPPTKYPFAGQAAGGSNPTAQIRWMAAYISGRYGDPIRAAQHEAAFNWYDQGGWLPTGASLSMNNTGSPEAVIPSKHLEQMIVLLDELCGLVAANNQITAAAPTATGAGLGAVLGAHARKATYRAMYS